MARNKIDFESVRKIAVGLPGVEASTAYGCPALKVRGKLMACVPASRSAEVGSLVVCVDREERVALLAEHPDVYYVTNHYVGYDTVLVRLSRVSTELLEDILRMAHRFAMRKTKRATVGRKKRGGKSV
jgi:hypothetical protein